VVETNGTTTTVKKTYYAGSTSLAVRTIVNGTQNTLNWTLGDHLGSSSVTTTANGTWYSELRYSAFGETRYSSGITPTDYRYTGQLEQADVNLYYYNARWYDPELGRFIQADTIVPEPGSAKSYDRYMYVNNNPVRYTDPSGHKLVCGFAGEGCGGSSSPNPSPIIADAKELARTETINALYSNPFVKYSIIQYSVYSNIYNAYKIVKSGNTNIVDVYNAASGNILNPNKYIDIIGESISTWNKNSSIVFSNKPIAERLIPIYKVTKVGVTISTVLVGGGAFAKSYFTDPKVNPSLYVSRGSTGRTEPYNLTEQLMMEEVKSDPLINARDPSMKYTMGDYRWSAEEGWVKMEVPDRTRGITIHFNWNKIYGWFDDFKFVYPK
jgi:RHS repeat-associated protein